MCCCRREIDKNVSRLVEGADRGDEFERSASAPPHLADDRQAGFQLVRSLRGADFAASRQTLVVFARQLPAHDPTTGCMVIYQSLQFPSTRMLCTGLFSRCPPSQTGAAAGPGDARGFSPDQYTDIRYDEEYEKFYRQSVANGVKLPPPVDSTTLYSQLPQYSKQHAPPRPPSSMLGPQTSYGAEFRRHPTSRARLHLADRL